MSFSGSICEAEMLVHPQITMANGIVTIIMMAEFTGDPTDQGDQQRIVAYGDPKVNIAGTFTDPADSAFAFTFPASEKYVGVTTDMSNHKVRFMTALPVLQVNQQNWNPFQSTDGWNTRMGSEHRNAAGQRDLDCLVTDAVHAATVWAAAIDLRVQAAMTTLRSKTPAQLTSLPDAIV